MTEADILLMIANTVTSRVFAKKSTPGMLRIVRQHLETNKHGFFEKCGELKPDLKPKQPLWRLIRNADVKSVPESERGTFVDYTVLGVELFMLSPASASNVRQVDAPAKVKPVANIVDDDDDDEDVDPTLQLQKKGAKKVPQREKDEDVEMATEGAPASTRGKKRSRGSGDDDGGDTPKTARLAPPRESATKAAQEAAAQEAAEKEAATKAAQEAAAKEAAEKEAAAKAAQEAAAKEAAEKEAAAKAAREAAEKEAAAKAAREAVEKEAAAKEAAAKAAQEAAAKEAAAKAAKEAAAKAAIEAAKRKRAAEAEEERRLKEAKDARVREAQEKLRTLRREKDERHPGFSGGVAAGPGPSGVSGPSGGSSDAAASSAEALEARRLWEADAAWWSKHGPKAVDPDSGKRRLFTKPSETSGWHFTAVQKSFPNGFVYVADDRVVDEARRRLVLGMPADAAHLLAKKIQPDTAIFLCRVSSSDSRDKGKGGFGAGGSRPRLDLDVYGAAEPYPHAEKGAPPVSADPTAFGGRLPAQIKLRKRRCFGVSLRDDLGSAAVSGGLVDLRGVSLKTEQKLNRAESLMPVLLKNAKRTDALVAELRARAREAVRAKRGLP